MLYEDEIKGAGYESTINGEQVTAKPTARDALISSQVNREAPNKRFDFNYQSILKPTSQLIKKRGENLIVG